jgi:hypothetical protein
MDEILIESEKIKELTGLTDAQIDQVLKWFGGVDRVHQLAVFREPVRLKYHGHTAPDIKRLAAVTLAAYRVHAREVMVLKRKNLERNLAPHDSLHQLRIAAIKVKQKRKKPSPKLEAIRVHLFTIDALRERDRLTWRGVAEYLKQHAGLIVSAGYLHLSVSKLKELEADL